MTATRKPHPIEALSFVVDRAPKSRSNVQRCFWHVQPTGDYGEDCRTGHRFAIEYLRYERAIDNGSGNLPWIVTGMPRELTGIEVGFLGIVGRAARLGLHEAEQQLVYWEDAEIKRTHGAIVSLRSDGSALIEEPNGKRAVYRKVGEA